MAVVLHSDDRWSDATTLLDYGFDFTRLLKLASAGQVAYLPLVHGLEPVICARSIRPVCDFAQRADRAGGRLMVAVTESKSTGEPR